LGTLSELSDLGCFKASFMRGVRYTEEWSDGRFGFRDEERVVRPEVEGGLLSLLLSGLCRGALITLLEAVEFPGALEGNNCCCCRLDRLSENCLACELVPPCTIMGDAGRGFVGESDGFCSKGSDD
jgi:hypothetical protein